MRIGLALPAMLDGARSPPAAGVGSPDRGRRLRHGRLRRAGRLPQPRALHRAGRGRRGRHRTGRHRRLGGRPADALGGRGGQAAGDARRRSPADGRCSASASGGAVRGLPRPRAPVDRRWERLDAQVARLRRLWAGEPPAPGLDPVGPPPVHRIPILSAGVGPRSLARSAAWADGINGFELDPERSGPRSRRRADPSGVGDGGPRRGSVRDDVMVVHARRRPRRPAPRLRPPLPRRVRRRPGRRPGPRLHRGRPGGGPGLRWRPPRRPATTRSSSCPPSTDLAQLDELTDLLPTCSALATSAVGSRSHRE